eukprot:2949582-Lingulodinium_polyedra.AAC.1
MEGAGAVEEGPQEPLQEPEHGRSQWEEEEAAGDFDDPFAMMRGMGEEQVYKVTLLDEAAAADGEPEEEEEAA